MGSGFHPELTGRENVYLSGSILGMRRREITENFDRIVDFAGVRQFIDTPVKRYSSGMYVRLGLRHRSAPESRVLLLDEVLAVGDASFQEKCLARIDELKHGGTTIVFISHDLGAVERLCDRAILMQKGAGRRDRHRPHDVIAEYERAATKFIDVGIPKQAGCGAPADGQGYRPHYSRSASGMRPARFAPGIRSASACDTPPRRTYQTRRY